MSLTARCFLTLGVAAGAGFALAQTAPQAGERSADPQALDIASIMSQVSAVTVAGGSSDAPLPKFEDATRGMISKPGLFTLWFYPETDQDKDQERLLAQVPAGFLGEQFMLSTSISGGGFFTGFPNYERVVRWDLMNRQLLLIQPETRYVVDASKDVSDVVQRTYPERILAACPLVTKAPNGDPVIDLGPLLKSEFADVGWTGGGTLFSMIMGGAAQINPSLSKWNKKKAFELNVEIGVELAIAQPSPPGSFEKRGVHYSFWKLPQSDYQPRAADDRVGYFLTSNQDWSKPTASRDIYNRYINRWHLVKRDPALEMCEPRTPIVFYIEKTVPVRFRKAVRDGILEWNKAFEKCGFVNAVEVRQQTNDNEWKDLDPEDMRYSFFRWIVTGAGFAMGPSRANPFTGQLYDADIVFDDSMVRFFETESQHYLPSALAQRKFSDPALRSFLAANPEWQRPDTLWRFMSVGEPSQQHALQEAALQRLHGRGLCLCDYAQRMKHEVALGGAVLAGQPREVVERFLYDIIKEVVMHEVGHTLGLRHNFKASSIYTLEEIQKRRATNEATAGSVMDYNATLLLPDNPTEGRFVTPTLGPYDYWAIEYGYRPYDGKAATPPASPEPSKPRIEGPAAASADQKPGATPEPAGSIAVDLNDIPAELRAQLPPDVREALEKGDTARLMALAQEHGLASSGGSNGALPQTPTRPAAAPEFKTPPAGEEEMLRQIAARATEPELAYATDEDTTFLAPDPTTNRFDVGKNPMDWAEARIRLVDTRMKNILEWAVKDQEEWYHLRSAFLTLYFEKLQILDFVGRYVGGQYFHRTHRGDKDAPPPFVLVDAALQRRALQFTVDHLYRDEYLAVSPQVLNHLAPPRWWDFESSIDLAMDFPIREMVSTMQWWNLFDRFFPNTLRRIHDAELKAAGGDAFTLAEYLQTLQKACWDDAVSPQRAKGGGWSDAKPFVSGTRRSLQREYLGILENLVRGRPGAAVSADIHAMLTMLAKDLSDQIGGVLNDKSIDFASRAHLTACKSRIDRALSAELPESRAGSSAAQFMRTTGGN